MTTISMTVYFLILSVVFCDTGALSVVQKSVPDSGQLAARELRRSELDCRLASIHRRIVSGLLRGQEVGAGDWTMSSLSSDLVRVML